MGRGGLKKHFSAERVSALRDEPLFRLLAQDVAAGDVFPAVRDEEMHFYYEGARLLSYKTAFKTHSRYQCGSKRPGEVTPGYEPLRMGDSVEATYSNLKATCAAYRSGGELKTVAQSYRDLSHARRGRPAGAATLLDVEIRFPGLGSAQPRNGQKGKCDMVDMVFALPCGRLCFVEAKRTDDTRARSKTEPEVARQIRDYESQVQAAEHIVDTYDAVQAVLAALFGSPVAPLTGVFPKVPLLILGEWRPSSQERWQAHWLERSSRWALDDEFILIDGAGGASPSLQRFLGELDRRLA